MTDRKKNRLLQSAWCRMHKELIGHSVSDVGSLMYMDLYYDLCEAVGEPRKVPVLLKQGIESRCPSCGNELVTGEVMLRAYDGQRVCTSCYRVCVPKREEAK